MKGNKASLLHFALESNDEEIVEYLVFNGADCALPNEDGKLPVHIAAVMGNTQFLRYLDAKCHSIEARTADGVGAIHFASLQGTLQTTKYLLSYGADPFIPSFKSEEFDIDAHNNRMETLLHIAAKSGNTGHLAYLLVQGADLDKKGRATECSGSKRPDSLMDRML